MGEVAVDVEGGGDFSCVGGAVDGEVAGGFEQGEVDVLRVGVLLVLLHEVEKCGIVVAGDVVGAVVGKDVVGNAVEKLGGEAQTQVRKDEFHHEAPHYGIAVGYWRHAFERERLESVADCMAQVEGAAESRFEGVLFDDALFHFDALFDEGEKPVGVGRRVEHLIAEYVVELLRSAQEGVLNHLAVAREQFLL